MRLWLSPVGFALVAWLSFMSLRSGIRMRRHVKKVGRLVAYEEWPDVAKAEFRRMLRFMAANSALILVLLLLQIWDRVKD